MELDDGHRPETIFRPSVYDNESRGRVVSVT